MTLGERIKYARKQSGYTQVGLASDISITQGSIAGYETDRTIPSDRSISDIARVCNVDEHWLRTGEGSPEIKLSEYQEIERFVDAALSGQPDDVRRRALIAFSRLDADGWAAVNTLVQKLVDNL